MKSLHHRLPTVRGIVPAVVLFATLIVPMRSPAQSDDFNDGNDVGWAQYDPLKPLNAAWAAAFTFPNGGYRIQTPYMTGMANNPGRAGSLRPEMFTDFYVEVDVVAWNGNLRQSFGLLARVNNPGLQTTTGYAFTWDRGNPSSTTSGDVDISRITGEVPAEVPLTVLTNAYGPLPPLPPTDSFRFTNGFTYRLVFIGRGSELEGRVYQLPDLNYPKLAVKGTDSTYPSGRNGLVVFDNSGGQGQTDATFDNWLMLDVEPPRLVISTADLATGDLILTWPGYASNFVLECSTVLPNASWTPSTDTIFAPHTFPLDPNNPNYLCFTSIGMGNKFYRLRRPAQ